MNALTASLSSCMDGIRVYVIVMEGPSASSQGIRQSVYYVTLFHRAGTISILEAFLLRLLSLLAEAPFEHLRNILPSLNSKRIEGTQTEYYLMEKSQNFE